MECFCRLVKFTFNMEVGMDLVIVSWDMFIQEARKGKFPIALIPMERQRMLPYFEEVNKDNQSQFIFYGTDKYDADCTRERIERSLKIDLVYDRCHFKHASFIPEKVVDAERCVVFSPAIYDEGTLVQQPKYFILCKATAYGQI